LDHILGLTTLSNPCLAGTASNAKRSELAEDAAIQQNNEIMKRSDVHSDAAKMQPCSGAAIVVAIQM
jgi:hypothetical protein